MSGLNFQFQQKLLANTFKIAAVEIKGLDGVLPSDLDTKCMLTGLYLDADRPRSTRGDKADGYLVDLINGFRLGYEVERVRNDGGMASTEFASS